MFVVTLDWIEEHKTAGGAWNKQQLAQLGVEWPPTSGWKKEAVGRKLSDDERKTFEAHSAKGVTPVEAAPAKEKVLDIHEFDELIAEYKEAQFGNSSKRRVDARTALKDAYRAALRAAGLNDR